MFFGIKTKLDKVMELTLKHLEKQNKRIVRLEKWRDEPSELGNMLYKKVLALEKWRDDMIYADDSTNACVSGYEVREGKQKTNADI